MRTRARSVPVPVLLTALAAALALTLVIVAWSVLAHDTRDAGSRLPLVRAASRESFESTSNEPAPMTPTATRDADATPVPPFEREVEREIELPPVPSDQRLLLVRRFDDRSPVAGAHVTFARKRVVWAEFQTRGGADEHALLDELGTSGTTDRDGMLMIPRELDALLIGARHGDLFGIGLYEPRDATLVLDMAPDDALRVQIVDARGRPQPGVVALFGRRQDILGMPLRRAVAEGSDAIAAFRGVAAFARMVGGIREAEWGVSVLVPAVEPPFVTIDPKALPAQPVVVTLPSCGSVKLTLVGRDGKPMTRPASARVSVFSRADASSGLGALDGRMQQIRDSADGVIEIPYVDVGLTLKVQVRIDHAEAGVAFVEGPKSFDERVERSVNVDFGPVAFTGSILREDDRALIDESISVRVVGARSDRAPFVTPCIGEGTTDAKGVFSIEVPVAGIGPGSFDCELVIGSPNGDSQTLRAVAVVAEKGGCARLGLLRLIDR